MSPFALNFVGKIEEDADKESIVRRRIAVFTRNNVTWALVLSLGLFSGCNRADEFTEGAVEGAKSLADEAEAALDQARELATRAGEVVESAQDYAADVVLPIEQEIALGRRLSRQLAGQVEFHDDRHLQAYVRTIGHKLVAEIDDKPEILTFHFYVIDNDAVKNAMALPGGHIYVYTGLLQIMTSEAALAGVLAHEIAHVTERHIASRMVAQHGLNLITSIAVAAADAPAIASALGGFLKQGAALAFSRDQESEADSVGLRHLVGAEYDPTAMVQFFGKLGSSGGLEILQSHPTSAHRMQALREQIAELGAVPSYLGRKQLAAMKSRI